MGALFQSLNTICKESFRLLMSSFNYSCLDASATDCTASGLVHGSNCLLASAWLRHPGHNPSMRLISLDGQANSCSLAEPLRAEPLGFSTPRLACEWSVLSAIAFLCLHGCAVVFETCARRDRDHVERSL